MKNEYWFSPIPPQGWGYYQMPRNNRYRGRRRENYNEDPPDLKQQIEFHMNMAEYLKKTFKDEKKEDKASVWIKLQTFASQLGGLIIIGFPCGFVVLKLFNLMLENMFK